MEHHSQQQINFEETIEQLKELDKFLENILWEKIRQNGRDDSTQTC